MNAPIDELLTRVDWPPDNLCDKDRKSCSESLNAVNNSVSIAIFNFTMASDQTGPDCNKLIITIIMIIII